MIQNIFTVNVVALSVKLQVCAYAGIGYPKIITTTLEHKQPIRFPNGYFPERDLIFSFAISILNFASRFSWSITSTSSHFAMASL